jgi:hypothetical protein
MKIVLPWEVLNFTVLEFELRSSLIFGLIVSNQLNNDFHSCLRVQSRLIKISESCFK